MRAFIKPLPEFMENLLRDPDGFLFNRNGQELLTEVEIKTLKDLTITSEAKKPNCVRLGNEFLDVLIVGDIHGDLASLKKILKPFHEEKVNSIVFLGDYVDRGDHSLLVYGYLLSLNQAYPKQIQLLRGNHEDSQLNERYGFTRELETHYPERSKLKRIIELLDETYNYLSICALTPKKTLCMHGGIPKGVPSLDDVNKIPKPHSTLIQQFESDDEAERLKEIMYGLLWNDPSEHISEDFMMSPRGPGIFLFSENALLQFLEKNSLNRITRAHESSRGGFENLFSGKALHIFSTQPYFNKVTEAFVLHETKDNGTFLRDLEFKEIKKIS